MHTTVMMGICALCPIRKIFVSLGGNLQQGLSLAYWLIVMWATSKRVLKDQMPKDPAEVIYKSILRMLPRNKLCDDLAFDLSLSALLGENIYNFGELLAHPIIHFTKSKGNVTGKKRETGGMVENRKKVGLAQLMLFGIRGTSKG